MAHIFRATLIGATTDLSRALARRLYGLPCARKNLLCSSPSIVAQDDRNLPSVRGRELREGTPIAGRPRTDPYARNSRRRCQERSYFKQAERYGWLGSALGHVEQAIEGLQEAQYPALDRIGGQSDIEMSARPQTTGH